MRWGEEKTIHFVQLYKELDCLWDVRHPDYKNKTVRMRSIENLVESMGIPNFTVKDACRKIRSLRSTFNQEMKKVTDSLKSDSGSEQVYRPSLKWFDDMNEIMSASSNSYSMDNDSMEARYEPLEGNSDIFVGDVIEEAIVIDSVHSEAALKPTSQKRPRRSYYHEDRLPSLHRPEDECDVIAKHIALQLRQMPTSDMLQANVEIQQVLLKYRLANFERIKQEVEEFD